MVMQPVEIVKEYRESKKKALQIEILADLNICTKENIVEALRAAGVDEDELPTKYRKKRTAGYQPKNKLITPTKPPSTGSSVQKAQTAEYIAINITEKTYKVTDAVKEAISLQMIDAEENIRKYSQKLKELNDFMQQCY